MKIEIAVAFFCALSLGLCLFLGAICWLQRKQNPSLRWLAGLLSVLALRLSKSVLTIVFPEAAFPAAVASLASAALIGPLAFGYVRALHLPSPEFSPKTFAHFAPAFLLAGGWVFLIQKIPPNWFFGVANLLTFAYLGFTAHWVAKHRASISVQPIWLNGFLGCLGLLCAIMLALMYCQNESRTYLFVSAFAALVLYVFSFWAVGQLGLVFPLGKKTLSAESSPALRELGERVEALFETQKTHTDAALTVQKLAQQLRVQPYLLSKAVNFYFRKSFPELLTHYRIRHAESLLQSPFVARFNIEAIAYESGFASLSAFYVAFKKKHGKTPAAFKKERGKLLQ